MNQITTQYVTEGGACFEQYVITDPVAKTALTITPERGGMITGFTLDGDEYIWTRRPNFSECNRPRFGVPVLFPSCGNPDGGVHNFDGKAYPMETHGFADLCAWDVESVGPDGVTLALESTPLTKFLYPFDFTLLGNYRLRMLLWAGDDEFPPSAQLLYSANFVDGFAAEDRVVAGDLLCNEIKANL